MSKQTDPLLRLVRTLEGALVVLFNVAMVVIPIVTSSLSPATAVKWAAVVNTATMVSRQGLKAIAALSQRGLQPTFAPGAPAGLEDLATDQAPGMPSDAMPPHLSQELPLPATQPPPQPAPAAPGNPPADTQVWG